MYKAYIDFSGYPAAQLYPVASAIYTAMLLAAATFDDPPVTMVDFEAHLEAYRLALQNRIGGSEADEMVFVAARHQLEQDLWELGGYVNGVAKGNQAIIVSSAFPNYSTAHAADPNPPVAPTNLVARQAVLSGSFVARYHVPRGRSVNEVQTNTADPTNEADWKSAGMFAGGTATVNGNVPGTMVFVRVRTVGLKGVMGAWSDIAQIRVI